MVERVKTISILLHLDDATIPIYHASEEASGFRDMEGRQCEMVAFETEGSWVSIDSSERFAMCISMGPITR